MELGGYLFAFNMNYLFDGIQILSVSLVSNVKIKPSRQISCTQLLLNQPLLKNLNS